MSRDRAIAAEASRLPPRGRSGLTLIELVASLSILAIIVGLLAVALNTSLDTWRAARSRARLVTQGRAILDVVARDLQQAVVCTNWPLIPMTVETTQRGGTTNSSLQFCRLIATPGTNQYAVEAVRYEVVDTNGLQVLCRSSQRISFAAAVRSGDPEFTNTIAIAEGLAAWRVQPEGTHTNSPTFIDIGLDLLSSEDARGSTGLDPKHAIHLARRVFLPTANLWVLP